jgi:methionine-rich copper-binding protein CopC
MAAAERLLIATLAVAGALSVGCAARDRAPAQPLAAAILASSEPAAGATVGAPVDELILRFNHPARLDEVTIKGPEGLMPAMILSVAEVADYSIPLNGLGPGFYTVNWKATAQTRRYQGSFEFAAK